MKIITVADVEYVAFRLAKEQLCYDEPIPDFSTRFHNVLESCVLTPFQKFGGKSLYRSLTAKAGILFYLMIKNHPFQNGNKRIAVTTLLIFLHANKKWLKADTQELFDLTMWVAQSPSKVQKHVVGAIEDFVEGNLVPLT